MPNLSTHNPAANGAQLSAPVETTDWSELDVRSAEVQEIIGRPPHGLVRWGITAFFGVLALVLLAAWSVKYPDTIKTPLKLTAIHAPKTLESKLNGKLVRLLSENDSHVEQGQVLAWMESTASHEQVLSLSAQVDSLHQWLQEGELQKLDTIKFAGFSDLGGLQPDFQTFEQAWRTFVAYLPGGFYHRQRKMLERELQYTIELLDRLREQKQIQEEDYRLARQEYAMQQKLAKKELIAPLDLARAESNLLARRLPLQQTESATINNYLSQATREKELMELNRQIAQQRSVFRQALNSLKSAIDEWKTTYLLIVPFDGKLIYAGILQENQSLAVGQEVFYIQPDNTHFFGELTVSQNSFGKVREGQQVLVRFSGYPYQEFGSVPGRVEYLSEIPVKDSVFFAKVNFPEGMSTNYGQELTPADGMRGQAEIITQDMRLLERMYNNIAGQLR